MKAANFTEFRTNLKQFLDDVENNNETLVIKRGAGHDNYIFAEFVGRLPFLAD